MIEPRVYRAAFVPALVAVVLVMFSLESRPAPLEQGLAADVLFDGDQAADEALRIAERNPDRRPGTTGNRDTAELVAETLSDRGFRVAQDRFTRAGRDLVNVVGRRAGRTREQIVVAAPRDALGAPDAAGSAADTAALLELARVFEGRPSRKTLVLASLDGTTLGAAGAERLAERLGGPELTHAVIVMSNLGAGSDERPIVAWSNDSSRAGIGLERTLAASLRLELARGGGGPGTGGQLARLAFPLGVGPQGVLLEAGYDALRVSGSGELPADPGAEVDEDRLGGLGRGTLRTLTALDQAAAPPRRGPGSYLTAVSQVLPGWALSVLALALLAPALVASVDAFARARRRRLPVAPWLRRVALGAGALAAGLVLAELLSFAGATPDPPAAPVAPEAAPLDVPAVLVLAAVTLVAAALWSGGGFLLTRADPRAGDPAAPGAACAAMLVVSGGALALWLVNPFAALLATPAVHLWLLATLTDPAPPRRARLVLVAAGAAPAAIVALYYLLALSMDPLEGSWYLLLLVIGGSVGLVSALLACVFAGALGAVLAVAARRDAERHDRPATPSVRGPATYAGPGSLGGTESALKR